MVNHAFSWFDTSIRNYSHNQNYVQNTNAKNKYALVKSIKMCLKLLNHKICYYVLQLLLTFYFSWHKWNSSLFSDKSNELKNTYKFDKVSVIQWTAYFPVLRKNWTIYGYEIFYAHNTLNWVKNNIHWTYIYNNDARCTIHILCIFCARVVCVLRFVIVCENALLSTCKYERIYSPIENCF